MRWPCTKEVIVTDFKVRSFPRTDTGGVRASSPTILVTGGWQQQSIQDLRRKRVVAGGSTLLVGVLSMVLRHTNAEKRASGNMLIKDIHAVRRTCLATSVSDYISAPKVSRAIGHLSSLVVGAV
jgi:hypothetical protein